MPGVIAQWTKYWQLKPIDLGLMIAAGFLLFFISLHTIKDSLYFVSLFVNNYSTHNLDLDDLFDVQSELNPTASNWKSLGLALRLKPDVLDTIQAGNTGNPTACLLATLKEWLNRNYNMKRFGEPTWQHLVKAVSHPAGGGNVSLATKIAQNHKAKSM